MLDNIPFEVQVEIIKRLPVKSLIQFRSASKTWKSLIDSSHFIARYSAQQTQLQHLLVTYNHPFGYVEKKYVSLVDDDTFPQQKVSIISPLLVNKLKCYYTIGSSHGLLCLYGDCRERRGGHSSRTGLSILWNISIRKAVAVVVPNVADCLIYTTILGFGVCRETIDPKIVKITYINRWNDVESISCIPWQVEVFALSTGAWRSPCSNLPRKSIQFRCSQEVVDGFLYWLATDRITTDGGSKSYTLIISLDMTSEEFREVNLPDSLAHRSYFSLSMSKLRESLVMLDTCDDPINSTFVVWMMEDGVPKSFTKLFTIYTPEFTSISGFRKSGEPIIEILEIEDDRGLLAVYEPYSKHIDNLGIDGIGCSFLVHPYMETLLLLDQPHHMVFNDTESGES